MAYYNICPDCGSNLDPGEKCTCMEERVRQQDFFTRQLRVSEAGQLVFAFDDEVMEKTAGSGGGENVNDSKVYHMSEDLEDKCLTEDFQIWLYLSPLRNEKPKRGKETIIEKAIIAALALSYSVFITYIVGQCVIESAASFRGYDAIGGEYILIIVVFLGTFWGMYKLLKGYKRLV